MTKHELAAAIAEATKQDKASVMTVIDQQVRIIKRQVAAGNVVYIRGFGAFGRKLRREKMARNITKGEQIHVPAHYTPFFKPYPAFKNLLTKNR